jgi:hypothetical protein
MPQTRDAGVHAHTAARTPAAHAVRGQLRGGTARRRREPFHTDGRHAKNRHAPGAVAVAVPPAAVPVAVAVAVAAAAAAAAAAAVAPLLVLARLLARLALLLLSRLAARGRRSRAGGVLQRALQQVVRIQLASVVRHGAQRGAREN